MLFNRVFSDFDLSRHRNTESAREYVLHNHKNVCEILFFISGDSSFIVEGTTYPLSREDFVIARHDEMHRVVHHSDCTYERVVINFSNDFFKNSGCLEYAGAFFERPAGSGNLFVAEKSRRAVEALHRLSDYAFEGAPEVILRGVLCELLRCISKRENPSEGQVSSQRLREIILYVNENLSHDLSLELLSKEFFISKYHLCRLFKSQTGMTLGEYITKKRLLRVSELVSGGMSITEAAVTSGFSDYSAYWHASKKQNFASFQ